jgi:hypothetical protein
MIFQKLGNATKIFIYRLRRLVLVFTAVRKYTYQAFGFTIASEIALPELIPIEAINDDIEIVIANYDLTVMWEKLTKENEYVVVKENMVMFLIEDVAIYLIEEGKRITISPFMGADEDNVRLYILGTCMATLLLQRKMIPLHGSTIAINGKAYAIVGKSGAGKSTLASAFIKQGYPLISDDITPITLNDEGFPYVIPSYPQQKLWQESLHLFGMDPYQYRPLVDQATKYAIPVEDQFVKESLPLVGIFELVKTERDDIVFQPIEKFDRLRALYKHTFRKSFLHGLGLMEWHFKMITQIANKLYFVQMQRPKVPFTAHRLMEMMVETIKGGCK